MQREKKEKESACDMEKNDKPFFTFMAKLLSVQATA